MPLGILKSRARGDSPLGEDLLARFETGVEVEGNLKASIGTVRINTHFSGEITSLGTVMVGERGDIDANIAAQVVTVGGKVKGNVHAGQRLEIKEHGVVLGDIHTRVLIVEAGGFFEGQCRMPIPETEQQTIGGEGVTESTK